MSSGSQSAVWVLIDLISFSVFSSSFCRSCTRCPPLCAEDAFTSRVLHVLVRDVRLGETVSYKRLAEMAGNPRAVRAVGGAMRRNPVSVADIDWQASVFTYFTSSDREANCFYDTAFSKVWIVIFFSFFLIGDKELLRYFCHHYVTYSITHRIPMYWLSSCLTQNYAIVLSVI